MGIPFRLNPSPGSIALAMLAGFIALTLALPTQGNAIGGAGSFDGHGATASAGARFHDCGGAGEPRTDNVVFVKSQRIRCVRARRIIGRWVRSSFNPSGGPRGWKCSRLRASPRGETRWLCLRGRSGLRLRFPCFGGQCKIDLIPGLRPCPSPKVLPPKGGGYGLIVSRLEVRRISCSEALQIVGAYLTGEPLPQGWTCRFVKGTGKTQCRQGKHRLLTYYFEGTAS